jgi:hypothetical protein
MIYHRPFAEELLQSIISWKIRLYVSESGGAFISEDELDFAELHGLKTRCRFKSVAEARERRRRHCLKYVHLRDEHFHDCADALERMNRAEEIASGKISFYFLELVQQLLKPQLVGLVDDDEQRLVVLPDSSAASERESLQVISQILSNFNA